MQPSQRAAIHSALGDERRLAIVDELLLGDRSSSELAELTDLPGNLLAHHLDVLEGAGLIRRHASEGDQRRRYVTLDDRRLLSALAPPVLTAHFPLFVCTHNSARSQFAAALWERRTGSPAESAGTHPAQRIHPKAVRVAAEHGIDLSASLPRGYDAVTGRHDAVISVCDRARESELPFPVPHHHWSIPDPITIGTLDAFRSAFAEIDRRIGRLIPAADEGETRP